MRRIAHQLADTTTMRGVFFLGELTDERRKGFFLANAQTNGARAFFGELADAREIFFLATSQTMRGLFWYDDLFFVSQEYLLPDSLVPPPSVCVNR